MTKSTKRLSLLAMACVGALATSGAQAGIAGVAVENVMGGSLHQMVLEADHADPRLAKLMARHLHDAAGNVLIQVHLKDAATAKSQLAKLAAAGLRITAVSKLDPTRVEGYVSLRNARAVAGLDAVRSVAATHTPLKYAGSVQSQAVAMEKADVAQSKGFDGTGIKVGAMSDSFNACTTCITNAAQDVATGDLPAAGVFVQADQAPGGGEDEGRAMLQLVHDIAPGAQLAFATAFNGEVDFSNQMLALRENFGADVLVDDVYYYDEPFYSDGLLAQTVDQVVAEGGTYFSSAGNNGLEAYEATYHALPFGEALKYVTQNNIPLHLDQIPADLQPLSVHVFAGGSTKGSKTQFWTQVTTSGASIIDLQWDDPFYLGKVTTDYNVYIFDANGNWIDPTTSPYVYYSEDDNIATDTPMEIAEVTPDDTNLQGGIYQNTYTIVIGKRNQGFANHIKYIAENTLLVNEFEGAPSVAGHNSAATGQGVGAIYYGITNFPEDFSSPGPVTIYLDDAGNRLKSPDVRQVPQIAAGDGVDTTFFGFDADGNGLPNFFGTSAAAPDAAAVAALTIEAAGGSGSIAPAAVYSALQTTATKVAVADQRLKTKAIAGPVLFNVHGDWTRGSDYYELTVDKAATSTVSSITFDATNTPTNLLFSANLARFYLGDSKGIQASDITVTESADQKQYTLTFAPGKFGPGDHFHFGTSVYALIQGSTQEDADRMSGMTVAVTMADGSTYNGTVDTPKKNGINRFTGNGLVNAYAATKSVKPPKN